MSFCERINSRNWGIYQSGCDRSKYEKAKFLQKEFIKPGIIVDMGSGTLIAEQMLSELYSGDKEFLGKIQVVGLDLSKEMINTANVRKKQCSGMSIDLIKSDITTSCITDESVDTVILFSTLHEIYSDYGLEKFLEVLRHAYGVLKPGGKLIIRDGVKPKDKTVYARFGNREVERKFYAFAKNFQPHSERHIRAEGGYKFDFKKYWNGMIELNLPDLFEFLVKYFYKENWSIEIKERWGVLTQKKWMANLSDIGFRDIRTDVHLLPYFRSLYGKDGIEIFYRVGGDYKVMDYPATHIIIAAEKAKT
jgi:SAM-dependent methyltransferase